MLINQFCHLHDMTAKFTSLIRQWLSQLRVEPHHVEQPWSAWRLVSLEVLTVPMSSNEQRHSWRQVGGCKNTLALRVLALPDPFGKRSISSSHFLRSER